MAAPAEFLVLRHRLSHPSESQADLARHTHLDSSTVSRVLKRLDAKRLWTPHQRVEAMRTASRRPTHKTYHFRAPNPDQWNAAYDGPAWLSGEPAAARDGYDLVPAKILVYVPPEALPQALRASQEIFAKLAPESRANLILREADPWLRADDEHDDLVERGQRLLDYAESKHIQLLQGLDEVARGGP